MAETSYQYYLYCASINSISHFFKNLNMFSSRLFPAEKPCPCKTFLYQILSQIIIRKHLMHPLCYAFHFMRVSIVGCIPTTRIWTGLNVCALNVLKSRPRCFPPFRVGMITETFIPPPAYRLLESSVLERLYHCRIRCRVYACKNFFIFVSRKSFFHSGVIMFNKYL